MIYDSQLGRREVCNFINALNLQLVTCHRLALARVSDVFAHLFYRPDNPQDDDEPIFVPEMSPAAFESMCG